jgi:hypothetical protein
LYVFDNDTTGGDFSAASAPPATIDNNAINIARQTAIDTISLAFMTPSFVIVFSWSTQ